MRLAIDDTLWENTYASITNITMSPDGSQTSATVQTEPLDAADIEKYNKGIYSPAPGGNPWERSYTKRLGECFSALTGKAWQSNSELNRYDYTIAVDGKLWDKTFPNVWEPCFNPATGEKLLHLYHQAGGPLPVTARLSGNQSTNSYGTRSSVLTEKALRQLFHLNSENGQSP